MIRRLDKMMKTQTLGLHRGKKLSVGLGLAEAFEDDFHLFDWRKWIKYSTHDPDAIEVFLADKEFFLTRTGPLQIDRREETLV